MSTKIYNGYRITGIETMKEYQAFIKEMRGKMQPLFEEAFLRKVACVIERSIDELTLCPEYAVRRIMGEYNTINESTENIIYRKETIWTEIAGEEIKEKVEEKEIENFKKARLKRLAWEHTKKLVEDRDFACDCEVVFIEANGKLLALLYTQNDKIKKVWEKHQFVQEYGYWNNVDQPEGVTDEEWERRKRDWDEALPGSGIPAREGSLVKMTYEFHLQNNEQIMSYFSTKEERAYENAVEIVEERYMEKLEKENPDFRPGKIVTTARKWLQTEEGKQLVDVEVKRIATLLRDITVEDIYKKCEDFLKEEN